MTRRGTKKACCMYVGPPHGRSFSVKNDISLAQNLTLPQCYAKCYYIRLGVDYVGKKYEIQRGHFSSFAHDVRNMKWSIILI